jgi:transposase
MRRDL